MEKNANTNVGRLFIISLFLTFTVLLVVTFYNDNTTNSNGKVQTQSTTHVLQRQTVSLEEVAKNPDQFANTPIILQGKVDSLYGTRGIKITSWGSARTTILVVGRQPIIGVGGGSGDTLYKKNEAVEILGTVKRVSLSDLENELRVHLDRNLYNEFDGNFVVVADSITPVKTKSL